MTPMALGSRSTQRPYELRAASSTTFLDSPKNPEPAKEMSQHASCNSSHVTLGQILRFSLPTLGIWISSPLLSLIDTSVVGRCASSLELAALGPATAICDQLTSVFLFLGVATTNILAGALADDDADRALEGATTGLVVAGAVGTTLAAALALGAGPLCRAFVGAGPGGGTASVVVAETAASYVVRRAPGLPFALMTVVAQVRGPGKKNGSRVATSGQPQLPTL